MFFRWGDIRLSTFLLALYKNFFRLSAYSADFRRFIALMDITANRTNKLFTHNQKSNKINQI